MEDKDKESKEDIQNGTAIICIIGIIITAIFASSSDDSSDKKSSNNIKQAEINRVAKISKQMIVNSGFVCNKVSRISDDRDWDGTITTFCDMDSVGKIYELKYQPHTDNFIVSSK